MEWDYPALMRYLFWKLLLTMLGVWAVEVCVFSLYMAFKTRRILALAADDELALVERGLDYGRL
jgi:hypothetical protein